MPPMIATTISLQSDAIVATSMAGEEVWRATEANISGRELKQALKEAIGHANFLMVTPEAEKLAGRAQCVQDQLRALANRKHPTYHRLSVNARSRLPSHTCFGQCACQSTLPHGCPVWKPGRPRGVQKHVDLDGKVFEGPVWGTMQKIPYALGEEVENALSACHRSRSRSRSRTRQALAASAQKVRDWVP